MRTLATTRATSSALSPVVVAIMAAPPAPALRYTTYENEAQLVNITALIEKALSEPYSVFTYRCAAVISAAADATKILSE